MNANKTVTGIFMGCYPLTTSVVGNGTFAVTPASNCTNGYLHGTLTTLKATPNASNAFINYTGDLNATLNPITWAVTGPASITVNFLPCYSLTKTVSPAAKGTLIVSKPSNCSTKYISGTSLLLLAKPATGQGFLEWSGSTTGSDNPLPLVMDADKDLTANFVPVPSIPVLQLPRVNELVTDYLPVFEWSDSTPYFDHYEIQVSSFADFSTLAFSFDDLLDSKTTPVSPLDPNMKYYWRVRSFELHGVTRGWSPASYFRSAMLPPVPGGPAGNLETNRPTFSWDPVDGATGYTLQISRNSAFTLLVGTYTSPASTSYTPLVDLPAATTIYWRVKALGPNGPSLWSFTNDIFTANPPSIPLLLAPPTGYYTLADDIRLDWSMSTVPAGTAFNHYQLQVADNPGFLTPIIDNSGLTDQNFHEYSILFGSDGFSLNTLYYWRVRAYNMVDAYTHSSSWSLVRTFRTPLVTPTLLSPSYGEQLLNNRPTLDWENVEDAMRYSVQIYKDLPINPANLYGTYPATMSSYTPLVDLPVNKTLYWRVQASGKYGPSNWSDVHALDTANPPGAPALIFPTIDLLMQDFTPQFIWTRVTAPSGTTFSHYRLQVSTSLSFTTTVIDVGAGVLTNIATPFHTLPDPDALPANTRYYWRVNAYNTDGEYSNWSSPRTFRTALAPPTLLYPEDAGSPSSLRPAFDWGDVSSAAYYMIQISKNDTFTQIVVTATTSASRLPPTYLPVSTYTPLVNLPNGITLYWRVRTNGPNGPSGWSPAWNFTIVP
jgi:hypothetical protein